MIILAFPSYNDSKSIVDVWNINDEDLT